MRKCTAYCERSDLKKSLTKILLQMYIAFQHATTPLYLLPIILFNFKYITDTNQYFVSILQIAFILQFNHYSA